ncbi:unnamed protein product [Amoebophrya sp. A25]|nr:unnamed protein product [Amoebophrya sp. A25]|eukprot:GSA25T00018017001.1
MATTPRSAGSSKKLQVFSAEEVAKHNKLGDLWLIIEDKVYDVSKFANVHPGGKTILLDIVGNEATQHFYAFHRTEVLEKYHSKLCIGTVEGAKPAKAFQPDAKKVDVLTAPVEELRKHPLISKTPFGESASMKKYYASPYMNDSHLRFRLAVREFLKSWQPETEAMEEAGEYPSPELWEAAGKSGILACSVGIMGMPYAKKFGIELPGGIKPEHFDFFHEQILHEESVRGMAHSIGDGLWAGFNIGLPPIINFYHGDDKDEMIRSIMLGEKKVVLAITGPEAGSDVANHTTTAKKSECGQYFIVRGMKKWITGGCQADYFVTAVRTGGPGIKGISMLLVKREEGVTTKQISTSYQKSAATALVEFQDAKVPAQGRLLGVKKGDELNKGFQCIMLNFNHERWMIACKCVGYQRLVLAECLQWLMQRKAFGRPLMDQAVLRFKYGQMAAAVETIQAHLDFVTYQMKVYYERVREDKSWKAKDYLAGEIGLLKYQATRVSTLVADNGCQIFGGRAVTKTGMGKHMERFQRAYKIASIYGGSEEIMADLGIRQALRDWDPEDKAASRL